MDEAIQLHKCMNRTDLQTFYEKVLREMQETENGSVIPRCFWKRKGRKKKNEEAEIDI